MRVPICIYIQYSIIRIQIFFYYKFQRMAPKAKKIAHVHKKIIIIIIISYLYNIENEFANMQKLFPFSCEPAIYNRENFNLYAIELNASKFFSLYSSIHIPAICCTWKLSLIQIQKTFKSPDIRCLFYQIVFSPFVSFEFVVCLAIYVF